MTANDLFRYIEDYRRDNFDGGMIPFDAVYHTALEEGQSPASAQRDGVYSVLDAFAQYVQAREAGHEHFYLRIRT